jgi:hypothetical protein
LREGGYLSKQQQQLQFGLTVGESGVEEVYFLQVPSALDMSAVYLCLAKTNRINSREDIIHSMTGGRI